MEDLEEIKKRLKRIEEKLDMLNTLFVALNEKEINKL